MGQRDSPSRAVLGLMLSHPTLGLLLALRVLQALARDYRRAVRIRAVKMAAIANASHLSRLVLGVSESSMVMMGCQHRRAIGGMIQVRSAIRGPSEASSVAREFCRCSKYRETHWNAARLVMNGKSSGRTR